MIPYREQDGWQLYYSEEGHPYYYNAGTGQSEWATHDSYFESISGGIQESPTQRNVNVAVVNQSQEADKDSVEEEEEEDENDEDGDDEESGDSSFDEAFDRKFKQYLQTAEGIAAVINEQERIAKFIEKEEKRKAEKRDYQYLKSLISSKKSDDLDAIPNNGAIEPTLLQNIVGSALSWLSTSESPNKTSSSNKSAKIRKTQRSLSSTVDNNSNDRVRDDFGRETKQRGSNTKRANSDNTVSINDIEIDPEAASYDNNSDSRSVSRSNSSSEIESLSSDDSDVAAIKTPLFGDLPPWLTWSFYNDRYFTPFYEYLDERGVTATVSAGASRTLQVGGSTLSFIAHQTWLLVMQVAIIGGEYTYVLATGIFERLRPHLVEFMEQVVDRNNNNNNQGSPNNNSLRAIASNANSVNVSPRVGSGEGDGSHPPTSPPPPFAEPRDNNTPIYTNGGNLQTSAPSLMSMPPLYDEVSTAKTALVADDQTMQTLAMGVESENQVEELPMQQEKQLTNEII